MTRLGSIILAVVVATALAPRPVAAQDRKVDFASQILPIIGPKCFNCHGAPKKNSRGKLKLAKAGLRLDGKYWILKGGDSGRVVAAGDPAKSPIYALAKLDPDDPDIMPAKGDPLTEKQLEVLQRWIKEGADFGTWEGASGPKGASERAAAKTSGNDKVPSSTVLLLSLAKGIQKVSPSELKKIAGDSALITPSLPGSPLLRVSFVNGNRDIDDRRMQTLSGIYRNITHLKLGKSQITDKALAAVGKMPNLVHLDLHETAVTDRGLASLQRLSQLRYLNLFGTKVSDKGLKFIAALPQLRAVYLWETGVTSAGIASIRQSMPRARIHHEILLPDPPAPRENNRRRRGKNNNKKKKKNAS